MKYVSRRQFLGTLACATLAPPVHRAFAGSERRRFKACVIGDTARGGYGHNLHLALALHPEIAVTGLADPDESGRARQAAACGAERTYADYREMLAAERPDLVVVGPRHSDRHCEYLLACVEAGAHGFMEKPLCVDLEEADAMRAAVTSKNLKWALAFNIRATPTVGHACRLVMEEDLIGTVLDLRGRGKEDHRSGGEDMIVLGAHVFDLMSALSNALPQWCFSDILQGGRPARPEDVREASEQLGPITGDSIQAIFGFPGGVTGFFASAKQPRSEQSRFGLDIHGSRGIVSIRFGAVPQIAWLDSPTWSGSQAVNTWKPVPGMPELGWDDPGRQCYKAILEDLLESIERDREPMTSLQQAVRSQEMIQAVFESLVRGGRVALPLVDRSHPLKRWAAA